MMCFACGMQVKCLKVNGVTWVSRSSWYIPPFAGIRSLALPPALARGHRAIHPDLGQLSPQFANGVVLGLGCDGRLAQHQGSA